MREPDDLFSASHYAAVRRPIAEAYNLPPWCYTSQRFFEREIETIFNRTWNFVCRAERLPNAGDYMAVDVATVPLIVARGQDGAIRAFSNTCRHRGCAVTRGEGNARNFVCPYHSWSYTLAGELIAAPTDMDETVGFKMSDYGLIPVRLETWAGFVFVNLDRNAAPLADHLGNLPELLERYDCANLRLGRRLEYDVPCNWKFYVENLKDAHHVSTVHAKSISRYASPKKYWRAVQPTNGNIISTFMSYPGSAALLAGDTGFPRIAKLTDETAGTTAPLVFPNLYISCTTDCAWYVYVNPVAVNRIRLEQGALFPAESLARPECQELLPKYFKRFDMTQAEDNEICALQHRGLRSPFSTPGRYSTKEALVHKTHNWILDRVLGS